MPFTEEDRTMLVKTYTDVGWIKETHERRLEALEEEGKLLHHRINVVRNLFTGITSTVTATAIGLSAWLKGN